VDASVAALVRLLSGTWDRETPSMTYFDHLMVYVPAQEGLTETWLDPSCAHCRAGELPYWSRGQETLVIAPSGSGSSSATFRTAAGGEARPELDVRTFHVRLDAAGAAEAEATLELTGSEAMAQRRRSRAWTAADREKEDGDFARARVRSFELTAPGEIRCNRASGSCVRKLAFRAPAFATADGDRLLVPLSLLWNSYDHLFIKEQRREDVAIHAPDRTEERILFEAPGYELSSFPPAAEVRSQAFTTSLEVSKTAQGAEVVRTMEQQLGMFARSSYPKLRKIVRDYAAARDQVLVFTRIRTAPAASKAP
jgi:hypothetical protein